MVEAETITESGVSTIQDLVTSKMNILEVIGICGGGLSRHVRSLCEGLIAQGHRVTIAYVPHDVDQTFKHFATDRRNEIRFVPLNVRMEISPTSDLRAIVQLLRLIKLDGPFDVIHGHSAKGGAIARIAGRWSGTPTVYTPHGLIISSPKIPKPQAIIYTLIERILGHWATSKIIAVSEGEREFVLKRRLVPDGRLVLIENAINDEDFEYCFEEAICEDLDQKPLTFGSTMRFDAAKAPDHLVEAFIRLNDTLPQVPMRLVIAGDGELFDEVKRQVEASELSAKISLLGWRSDIRTVLRELDVFVVPSLREAGLTYSAMEAMAAKLPIVSTNVFGMQEMVARVPGNVLVPVGDVEALARGMKCMATLAAEYGSVRRSLQRIGQANHCYVRARFEQNDIARRTLEIYQALWG